VRSIDPLESGWLELEVASPVRSLTRCRVCGFAELRTDEVVDRATLLLAECPRCEDRWTRSPAPPTALPVVLAAPARRARPSRPGAEEPAAAA
jgi:hypothetical protein